MLKLTLQFLFTLFLFTTAIYAQIEPQKPILIDEFGKLNAEESFARLDYLTIQLSKNKDLKAVIRINGGSENCYFCHYWRGSYTSAILKSRKHPLDKFTIEYCNENEDLRFQFYLMSPTSSLPACNQTLETPKRSVLFETVHFYSTSQIAPLENTLVASTSLADGEYSIKALRAVKSILDKESESKIYVVVYLGTNLEEGYYDKKKGYIEKEIRNLDKKSLVKKLTQNVKKEFVKNGIQPSQIEIIAGGYVEGERKLEFWFVPKGGEIPKPKPNYFPKR